MDNNNLSGNEMGANGFNGGAEPMLAGAPSQDTVMTSTGALGNIMPAAMPEEPKEKKPKAELDKGLVAMIISVAGVVLALVATVMAAMSLPRVATLENTVDKLTATTTSLEKRVSDLQNKLSLAIDVEFHDGGVPGMNYTVSLDPVTRELVVTTLPGCSLPDPGQCTTEPTIYTMSLSQSEYDLVVESYKAVEGAEDSEVGTIRTDLAKWAVAVLAMMSGNATMADSSSTDWENVKVYDADDDGRVTQREYGVTVMTEMIGE